MLLRLSLPLLLCPLAAAQVGGFGASAASRGTPLSQVPWVSAQGGLGPVEVDSSVGGPLAGDGAALTIGGRVFASGLGTASTSLITYDLRGGARIFSSYVGVDDEVGSAGSVSFQVLADGVLLFDSGLITGVDGPLYTGALDVRGVRELQLLVLDGGDGSVLDHGDWADPHLLVQPGASVGGSGATFRGVRGQWDPPMAWPVQPIHASLLPGGHLLSWASVVADEAGSDDVGDPHDSTRVDLSNVITWSHQPADHPSLEIYGAGVARAHSGEVVAVGGFGGRDATLEPYGRVGVSRFDALNAAWVPTASMSRARWGSAALTLGNGDLFVIGGANAAGSTATPEVFDGCRWRRLEDIDTSADWSSGEPSLDGTWAFVHASSDGRVFVSGWDERVTSIDVRGRGAVLDTSTREPFERAYSTHAAYSPDKVLLVGGLDREGGASAALRSAVKIDFTGINPTVEPAGEMLFARCDSSGVVLADGSVFVHGGALEHSDGANPGQVRVPELWDPETGTWSVGAASTHPRGYRSTALLLPDGRVWSGGGECGPGCTSGETAEVYSPPYLFGSNGAPATRPVILTAPGGADYGEDFSVVMADGKAVSRVTLIRYGSASHGSDLDQRFLELDFTKSGATLTVSAPANGYLAPPGPYHLFVFNSSGVPSVSAEITLSDLSPSTWEQLSGSDGSACIPRHETAMVEVGGRYYLIGGRGSRPVQEYDPVERVWRTRGFPPQEIHHFQPVVVDGLVWVVGAFVGGYPNETPISNILIYDPLADSWTTGPAMPPGRNRGSAGAVVHAGKIWFVGGNTLGHNGGAVPWFDVFDPQTGQWTQLPDAPHARDHFLVAISGNRLVAAGGRETDQPNPFDKTIPEVDIYDLSTGQWSVSPNDIPTERAGTMAAAVGQHVVVIGGESDFQSDAHDEVEALDTLTGEWFILPPLAGERHSGGVAVHDGRILVASGAGDRGGGPELTTFERLDAASLLQGTSTNPVLNSGFDEGLVGWSAVGDAGLAAPGNIKSPSLRVSAGDVTQELPLASGAVTLMVHYVANAGAGTARVELEFLDGSGGVLTSTSADLVPTPSFTTLEVPAVAPAGTASVRIRALAGGGRDILVDDVSLVLP